MADERHTPRLYSDLADLWRFVSPPEHYVEEAATFRKRLRHYGVLDGGSVLHLGSGGGSVDFQLKQWYRVTGVDLSEAMLDHARRVNPDVEYIQGDMRSVRLDRTFDAVLVHDAISYMTSVEELEMVYRTAAAHLSVGGVMIGLPEELKGRLPDDYIDIDTQTDGARTVTMIETKFDADPDDNEHEAIFIFLIRDGGEMRVEVDRHHVGIFTLDEFLGAMRMAGFAPRAEPWELSDWTAGQEMPLITAIRAV
jgi:SAM-dependent methyltransferase